jgi:purine-cytosine permease-like protein
MQQTTSGAVSAIEERSIDWVPVNERHGRVWQQGPFWFLGNFQPFTVAIGLIGPSLGLSLSYTILASVVGIVFGTLFMAFHASQGPRLGLPQMIQSRAQFGYRGVVIALVATLFTFIGFNVVDSVLIDAGLKGVFGWNATAVGIVITVIAVVLAVYGHDWLHRAFRVLSGYRSRSGRS